MSNLHICRSDSKVLNIPEDIPKSIPLSRRCRCGGTAYMTKCTLLTGEWYDPQWIVVYECPNGKQKSRQYKHKQTITFGPAVD